MREMFSDVPFMYGIVAVVNSPSHGLVQFCKSLKKFTRAYLYQIALEIM